jgi:hypothetical protein
MIQGVSAADRYVYHYTTATKARDFILKAGTLRLGPYSSTNDPKEAKQWEFSLFTTREIDVGFHRHDELSDWLSGELKRRTRLACFSMDSEPLSGDHLSDILRRGYAKPRMWAQYADKHSGVCLVLSKKLLLASAAEYFGTTEWASGPVTYLDRSILRRQEQPEFVLNLDMYESLGAAAYALAHARTFTQELFFEKLQDWRDENEWRIVAFTDAKDDVLLPIRQCLVGVMHGDATDPDLSEELMKLTRGWNGVEHMGLSWKNSSPWYDYGSFGWTPGKVSAPRRPPDATASPT